MTRYIDAEEFKRKLIDEKNFFPAIVARALDEMPTADVVPKSEVEKIFEEVDSMISLVSAMTGLDIIVFGKYAELKKKYTEEVNGSTKL